MKLTKKTWMTAAALCAVAMSGVAQAIPTTWTDTIDFKPDKKLLAPTTVTYTHVLDNFHPLVDWVEEYSLKVNLYDDSSSDGKEVAIIREKGSWGSEKYFSLSGTEWGGPSLVGWLQIALTGTLTVQITADQGDFYLGDSTLTVWGHSAKAVSEPGTLALFGAALIGFGLMRRKRQQV